MTPPSIFDPSHFKNPANAFRPLQIVHGLDRYLVSASGDDSDPAGQWNTWLQEGKITATLPDLSPLNEYLEKLCGLGVGGIVANVGFDDYLVRPAQWELLRRGLQKAVDLGLRIWLYDEKGYPSGTAGGIVTRADPSLAALGLACYIHAVRGPAEVCIPLPASCRRYISANAFPAPQSLSSRNVLPISDGIDEWQTLHWQAPEGEWTLILLAERVMYEGTHSAGNVSEFKHYINPLNPGTARAFLRLTHEAYHRELPAGIWQKVEAIFTDEPSFMTHYTPPLPERYWGKVPVIDTPIFKDRPMAVPWIEDFPTQFQARKGYDLLPHLYALFFSSMPEACIIRQDYYEVLTALYGEAFFDPIQDWCHDHHIESSGHVLLEENILDHAPFLGSLFSALRRLDLPGIDMLNGRPQEMLNSGSFMGESIMAPKQASSAAHLTGHPRIHSESSDWEQHNRGEFASLEERCGQANLQFVLGINQITSYFGWAELGETSWRTYNDYVGRLSSLLTGGRHICDVAVLYPIRSMWAHFLPPLQPIPNWSERHIRDEWAARTTKTYPETVKTLLSNQIDLDIIDEEAVLSAVIQPGGLCIADETYRVVILPPLDALSLQTVQALAGFARSGGLLISLGPGPSLAGSMADLPALQDLLAELFYPSGPAIQVNMSNLVETLHNHLEPDILLDERAPQVFCTHRQLEGRHLYFLTNNAPSAISIHLHLRQAGPYHLYRPLTGSIEPVKQLTTLELAPFEGLFIVCKSSHQEGM